MLQPMLPQEESAKNGLFSGGDDGAELADEAMNLVRTAMLSIGPSGHERAVIVINAQSTIQMTNPAATEL